MGLEQKAVDKAKRLAIVLCGTGAPGFQLLPVRHAGNGLGRGYFLSEL